MTEGGPGKGTGRIQVLRCILWLCPHHRNGGLAIRLALPLGSHLVTYFVILVTYAADSQLPGLPRLKEISLSKGHTTFRED